MATRTSKNLLLEEDLRIHPLLKAHPLQKVEILQGIEDTAAGVQVLMTSLA